MKAVKDLSSWYFMMMTLWHCIDVFEGKLCYLRNKNRTDTRLNCRFDCCIFFDKPSNVFHHYQFMWKTDNQYSLGQSSFREMHPDCNLKA